METITKISDTVFRKEVVQEQAETIVVDRTLDDVLRDISGTEAWITQLESDLVKAQEQLATFLTEKSTVEELGIVSASVQEATAEVLPE